MNQKASIRLYTFFYREGQLVANNPIYKPVLVGKNHRKHIS